MSKNLQEKIYSMSNSFLPLDTFFNDIRDNKCENYDKEMAYKDLEIIADFITDLQEQLVEKGKEIRKLQTTFQQVKTQLAIQEKDWNGNKNSVYKTLGASNHTDKEREENDFYATDPIAIDKLLTVEQPYKRVYECACGEGHLAKRLLEKDCIKEIYASDIVNRGYGFVQDFLQMKEDETSWIKDCDILTNPPYKYAKEFVLKALDLAGDGHKVYMFLKLTFLEGKSRYKDLFSKYPPQKIYVFSERVMCAKNGRFDEMKAGGGSAVAYAWFIWQKGWKGKTTIEWI